MQVEANTHPHNATTTKVFATSRKTQFERFVNFITMGCIKDSAPNKIRFRKISWGLVCLPLLLLALSCSLLVQTSSRVAIPGKPSLGSMQGIIEKMHNSKSHHTSLQSVNTTSDLGKSKGGGAVSPWHKSARLEWLHIPKAGTSFGNMLVKWACPWQDVETPVKTTETNLTNQCSRLFRIDPGARPHLSIADHISLENRTVDELQNVFTILRSPKTRLASGYHMKTGGKYLEFSEEQICADIRSSPKLSRLAHSALGVQTRMIIGQPMTTRWPQSKNAAFMFYSSKPPTAAEVELACLNLHLFAFLGVSDYWDATVCLFHKMYGGTVLESDSVHLRQGRYTETPYAKTSVDCGDTADESVFACAMHIFISRLRPHPECLKLVTYKEFGNPTVEALLKSLV